MAITISDLSAIIAAHRLWVLGDGGSRADLSQANLSGAYLSGADLSEADLIDGGQRADGYRFIGQVKGNTLIILAGCCYFPIAKAREHWLATRGGTKLGAETICILDHIEAVAKIRGMT
jgi:hypothetical protein